jgi:hypothetical protein
MRAECNIHPGPSHVKLVIEVLMKTFSLEEAQSLLPLVESLLKRATESKQAAEEIESDLSALARRIHFSGGMTVDVVSVAKQRATLDQHVLRARETLAEIDEIGVQVKDLDAGLLDFPCRVEDELVLLCWKSGESVIEHWHTMDAGFKGRQPIDDRFRRRTGSNFRPN